MTKKRHVILGAGISGLAAAWHLKQKHGSNIDLTILESSHRPGGWIQTIQKNGFLFEQGPRSCRPHDSGIATLQLIEELNLQDQVIFASPAAKKRYLYRNQKLQCLPTGMLSILFSPFRNDFLAALWKDWRTPKGSQNDETIHDFISRRLGNTFAETFFDPLVSGIYAGDIRKLSFQSCFPKIYEWEQNYGSLIKGAFTRKPKMEVSSFIKNAQRKGIFTLKNGMESLIEALAHRLHDHLKLNCKATQLQSKNDQMEITLADGSTLIADHLYSTLAAKDLAAILPYSQITEQLRSMPSTSIAVVNLGFKQKILKQAGFGYLIPSKEKEEILGVVWDSSTFPEQNRHPHETRMTIMIGGEHMLNFSAYTDKDFIAMALRSLEKHMQISTVPDCIAVKIANSAIPQYVVGYKDKKNKIESELKQLYPKLILSGTSFQGVSVNDCIERSNVYKKLFGGIQ